jgi:hypothetical protein
MVMKLPWIQNYLSPCSTLPCCNGFFKGCACTLFHLIRTYLYRVIYRCWLLLRVAIQREMRRRQWIMNRKRCGTCLRPILGVILVLVWNNWENPLKYSKGIDCPCGNSKRAQIKILTLLSNLFAYLLRASSLCVWNLLTSQIPFLLFLL